MSKPLFIVFEGIDGSGKSTVSQLVVEELIERGERIWHTFEPTNSEVGKLARTAAIERDPAAFWLFVADRARHDGQIMSHLVEGTTVVCDRHIASNLAYQADSVSMEQMVQANQNFKFPDIILYFKVSPEVAIGRIKQRGEDKPRSEACYQNLINNYDLALGAFEKTNTKIFVVDANMDIESVKRYCLRIIDRTGRWPSS